MFTFVGLSRAFPEYCVLRTPQEEYLDFYVFQTHVTDHIAPFIGYLEVLCFLNNMLKVLLFCRVQLLHIYNLKFKYQYISIYVCIDTQN